LAVVLLFGTILFTHSLRNLRTIDLGYRAENILNIDIGRGNGARSGPIPFADLLDRVRGLPGVESATVGSPPARSGAWNMTSFNVGRSGGESDHIAGVYSMSVGPDYFTTMQTPLLLGREFQREDRSEQAAVVVNERLAELAWPGENPIGKRISGGAMRDAEVIGVVGNSKYTGLREEVLPIVYRAFFAGFTGGAGTVQIRYRGSKDLGISEISRLVASAAPGYAVSRASTLEDLRDTLLSQDRLLAFLSTLFGILGVGLALVGIYGLISYSVTQRTHEIGVRVSVGAQRSQIVRLVLSEATALVVLGIAVGVPAALALSRWLESLLFEVTPSDPSHVFLTLGVLLAGGMVAAYIPALRATRIDPLKALKAD
jgi:predicted permease